MPVDILGNTKDGMWVRGLAAGDRLITVGHEFVKSGQPVEPVLQPPTQAEQPAAPGGGPAS